MLDQSGGVAWAKLVLGLDAPAEVKRAERMRSDLDRLVYWRDSASKRTQLVYVRGGASRVRSCGHQKEEPRD